MVQQKSIYTELQDKPLSIRDHLDPDKHWIGEGLGVPTQTEIAATVGGVASPGESPFVARADHMHKIGQGVITKGNIAEDVLPSFHADIGVPITTSGTVTSIASTVTVPSKVRSGHISVNAFLRVQKTVVTDIFAIILVDSVAGGFAQFQTYQGTAFEYVTLSGWRAVPVSSPRTITLEVTRVTGTGTASCIAGAAGNNTLQVLFIPT